MRMILITVNILLACYLTYGAIGFFSGKRSTRDVVYSVKQRTEKKVAEKTTAKKTAIAPFSGDAVSVIATQNIFDSSRCANALSLRGRSNQISMTLVGTFQVGEDIGAIILMKRNSNDQRMGPGMTGAPGMMGGPPGMGGDNASRSSRRDSSRSRFGSSRWNSQNSNATESTEENKTTTYKQYIRRGESLDNGYVLAEVSRSKVTLTRGSEKLDLNIQEASKNAPATVAANNSASQNQNRQRDGMQNMMRMMQGMQMMQSAQMMGMMRSLQNNNNNTNRNSRSRNNNSNNNNNNSNNSGGGMGGGFGGGGMGGGFGGGGMGGGFGGGGMGGGAPR